MRIQEFQGKKMLSHYGIKVPYGRVFSSRQKFANFCEIEIEKQSFVLKAQILSGARGKVNAVQVVRNPDRAMEFFDKIHNKLIKTKQNPAGLKVSSIYAEKYIRTKDEFYFCAVLDQKEGRLKLIMSKLGGKDIEENKKYVAIVALKNIFEIHDFEIRKLLIKSELGLNNFSAVKPFITSVLEIVRKANATQVEINPFTIVNNEVICLDVKIIIDDNASEILHPYIPYGQVKVSYKQELMKKLRYVFLGGNIGCIVNGAGLAMAVMDYMYDNGMQPANFLDIGGFASREGSRESVNLLLNDKNISSVFIKIFGGIINCKEIAYGIKEALEKNISMKKVVINFEGNQASEAIDILRSIKQVEIIDKIKSLPQVINAH